MAPVCLQVISLTEREGFGWAVKLGCELASTPYVLIVQHDRIFMKGYAFSIMKSLQ